MIHLQHCLSATFAKEACSLRQEKYKRVPAYKKRAGFKAVTCHIPSCASRMQHQTNHGAYRIIYDNGCAILITRSSYNLMQCRTHRARVRALAKKPANGQISADTDTRTFFSPDPPRQYGNIDVTRSYALTGGKPWDRQWAAAIGRQTPFPSPPHCVR